MWPVHTSDTEQPPERSSLATIFSFPNLYAHEWKCPMLSKLCFSDVSGQDRKSVRVGKECLRLCRSRWSPYH